MFGEIFHFEDYVSLLKKDQLIRHSEHEIY